MRRLSLTAVDASTVLEYVNGDQHDDTCTSVSDEDIINIVASTDDQQHESDDDSEEPSAISLKIARGALRTALSFC